MLSPTKITDENTQLLVCKPIAMVVVAGQIKSMTSQKASLTVLH